MIAALNGNVTQFGPNSIYFRVNNIEYEIMVPLNVLDYLQKIESENKLETEKTEKTEKTYKLNKTENLTESKKKYVFIFII